jgi:uncharacterized protein YozE (UPF0346 family)
VWKLLKQKQAGGYSMDERTLLNRINEMLADSDYPSEIKDVAELEEFLNDQANLNLGFYDEVEQLYNQLLGYEDDDE